jgi:hypothetical protein
VAGKLEISISASAERSKQPILDELKQLLPPRGKVLEIASGTGQHMMHFAAALPDIDWQPTDYTTEDFPAIAARRDAANLRNVADPVRLDVVDTRWPVDSDFGAIICINSDPRLAVGDDARPVRRALPGICARRPVWSRSGAYREGGQHTVPSNVAFDEWLKAKDRRFGVRNLEDVEDVARASGFSRVRLARLPANNLLVAFARSDRSG